MVPDCLFDIYTPNSEVVRIVFGRNNIINSIITTNIYTVLYISLYNCE